MIGEASAAEMQDLRRHLSECADCREQYREFTQFLLPQLSISLGNDASFETGYSAADKKQLRKKFLTRAQKNGFTFSQEALRGPSTVAA
ncbi:MAG: zf-HC2 domain-containing protein, partial [Terracidiphilus sp.]